MCNPLWVAVIDNCIILLNFLWLCFVPCSSMYYNKEALVLSGLTFCHVLHWESNKVRSNFITWLVGPMKFYITRYLLTQQSRYVDSKWVAKQFNTNKVNKKSKEALHYNMQCSCDLLLIRCQTLWTTVTVLNVQTFFLWICNTECCYKTAYHLAAGEQRWGKIDLF